LGKNGNGRRRIMIENVKDVLKKRKTNTERLRKEAPDIYEGFNELMKHYYKSGVLDRKQRELMAVACSTAQQCVP
jgi:alkylhydroperoxidase/carboxymuconolactone decarboxylase family protein YurZ